VLYKADAAAALSRLAGEKAAQKAAAAQTYRSSVRRTTTGCLAPLTAVECWQQLRRHRHT
jgi:hypothetical protein